MTRIISGRHKGRRLIVPASVTRPTSSRVREAVFSTVQHALGDFAGTKVLDLYAGSGAMGLEAMSRGALQCTFIEKDASAADCIAANIKELNQERAVISKVDVSVSTSNPPNSGPYDLVFLDPPYALPDSALVDVISGLANNKWLSQEAFIVVERSAKSTLAWPDSIHEYAQKSYGDTGIWYGVYAPDRVEV